MRAQWLLMLVVCAGLLLPAPPSSAQTDPQTAPPAPPPARKIPGITVEDQFPNACVSCHVSMPELDTRLSTAMAKWKDAVVEPRLLAKAQAAMPAGAKLKGKHPAVSKALENIPRACLSCHGNSATSAPPFGRMLHAIHLIGGEENHFLTMFQGECTHCHKLNGTNGAWSIPSGPEAPGPGTSKP